MSTKISATLILLILSFAMLPVLAAQQAANPTSSAPQDEAIAGQRPGSQLPPDIPHVTCENGNLEISADRATLLSVLNILRSCPGILIEMPNSLPSDQSYIRLGPGLQRDVLERLLSTISLDFVIQEIPQGSEKHLKIIFLDRSAEVSGSLAVPSSDPVFNRTTFGPARAAYLRSHEGHPSDPVTVFGEGGPGIEQGLESRMKGTDVSGQPAGQVTNEEVLKLNKTAAGTSDTAGSVTASTDPTNASPSLPVTTAPEAKDPAAKELQNKIKVMEQMFEQRKQLGTPPRIDPSQ